MNTTECPREQDVVEAVMSGNWPDGLRSHADRCPVCADLAMVAVLLHGEGDEAWREARVPTSGQVWWRATLRARAEAAAAAARPITMVQGLAGACAAGVSMALITLAWPSSVQPLLNGIIATVSREGQRIGAVALSATTMQQALWPVALVIGAALILTPFVLYLMLSED